MNYIAALVITVFVPFILWNFVMADGVSYVTNWFQYLESIGPTIHTDKGGLQLISQGTIPLPLVVRGERGADIPMQFPLHHEMSLQKTLAEQGIPVPTVYGWIDEPFIAAGVERAAIPAASGRYGIQRFENV